MFRFFGRMFRWSVFGGLILVGLVAVVGATRIKTAWWSVRDHLRDNVDELIDSKTALRHEVEKLAEEYARHLFGDEFVDHYVSSRDWEVREYEKFVTDWQLQRYFEII